jgi:D-alanine transaminase
MSRIAYVNGRYELLRQATVNIEDRGFQFADGVYEVCEVRGGRLVDERRHLARLERSLGKLRIAAPMPMISLRVIIREVVGRNRIRDGLAYVQVTRGVAPRAHAFPVKDVRPTLVVTARALDPRARKRAEIGIVVITYPENRWSRVDIKTIGLLPNVLAKQAAVEAGASEAWFIDADGMINEGAASNAWIVTGASALVTAPTTAQILEGVTRAVVLDTAERYGLTLEERRFSVEEAHAAHEAFITSATTLVTPVIRIDDRVIGGGAPGPIAMRLRKSLLDNAEVAPLYAGPLAKPS